MVRMSDTSGPAESEDGAADVTFTISATETDWVATHSATGVASRGETCEEALEKLDEAVARLRRADDERPADDERENVAG